MKKFKKLKTLAFQKHNQKIRKIKIINLNKVKMNKRLSKMRVKMKVIQIHKMMKKMNEGMRIKIVNKMMIYSKNRIILKLYHKYKTRISQMNPQTKKANNL